MLEFSEMRLAGNEEMRSRGACQGNEVIVSGVWRESGSYLSLPGAAAQRLRTADAVLFSRFLDSSFRAK